MIYQDVTHYPKPAPQAPAPTEYDPEPQGKNISIVSGFKSKAKREIMADINDGPGPTEYDPKK